MIDQAQQQRPRFIPEHISRDQAKDTGMAMVLVCLLAGILGARPQFFTASVVLLLLNMTFPGAYRPVAKIWLGLSHLMGTVMSRVILTVVFFLLLMPVGVVRRLLGHDSLQIRRWKKDMSSVFRVRGHTFTARDIANPY